MSSPSLKEAIAQKRAEEEILRNPLCSSTEQVSALFVETSNRETWLLPWNHFIFGHHQEAGERERLVLTFVAHEVAVSGLNLGTLVPEVAHQRLEILRTAPGKYLKSSGKELFIEQIQVHPLAEQRAIERPSDRT
jgi:hypothetical protein